MRGTKKVTKDRDLRSLKVVVLNWFMVSSCIFRWSFICQILPVNARNLVETTKIKSDVLETPVILVPEESNEAEVKLR